MLGERKALWQQWGLTKPTVQAISSLGCMAKKNIVFLSIYKQVLFLAWLEATLTSFIFLGVKWLICPKQHQIREKAEKVTFSVFH